MMHSQPYPRSLRHCRPCSIVILGLLLALWISPVAALERRTGDSVNVAAGQTVDDDLVIAGNSVTIAGRVTGDLFVAGNAVEILPGAQIDGDVVAVGDRVLVDGAVGGNVRSAANVLQLSSSVGRNVLGLGRRITLTPGAGVTGNWLSAAEHVTLQGTVAGNVTSAAQTIQVGAAIGRNAELLVETLAVQPTARIGGNLTYTAATDQAVPAGVVQGTVERRAPSERPWSARSGFSLFSIAMLGGTILIGLLLAWLFPGLYRAAQTVIAQRALVAVGVGLVTLIVVPVLAVILMVTVLGLPLGLVGLGAYLASGYLGWMLAAAALAGLAVSFLRRDGRPVAVAWLVVLGLLGLHVLTRIPVLGGLLAISVLCLGLGTVVLLIAEGLRRPPTAQPAPPIPAPAAPSPTPVA